MNYPLEPLIEATGVRVSWRDEAACADHPIDWWFPNHGHEADFARARLICRDCTVRDECLSAAFANEAYYGRYGMWGGLTPIERHRLVRKRQRLRRQPA